MVVLSLLGACASPDRAPSSVASACPRGVPPAYAVNLVLPEPSLDNSLSLAQITERAKSAQGHLMLGATESRMQIAALFRSRVVPSSAGGACAYVAQASLTLSLDRRVIHIANEFHGTEPCLYDEILGHEKRHVALDDKLLREASETLRANPPPRFAMMDGVWGPDEASARQEIQHQLNAATDALEQSIQRDRQISHALQIDTAEERRRMLAVCQGRLAQLHPELH